MKRIPVISLAFLVANTFLLIYLVYLIGSVHNQPASAQLKIGNPVNQRALADPLRRISQADTFVDNFHSELRKYNGLLSWPKDNMKYMKSWVIENTHLNEIEKCFDEFEIKDDKRFIRIYPVINDKGNFSFLIIGEYVDTTVTPNVRRLLKFKQDGKTIAPMYEWMEPCPPFNCPESDF